jgi:hypothetical protein
MHQEIQGAFSKPAFAARPINLKNRGWTNTKMRPAASKSGAAREMKVRSHAKTQRREAGRGKIQAVLTSGNSFTLEARVLMFHLDGQVGFNAGHRWQNVIQNLFCRHPEFPAARADLQPTGLVAVITLSEVPGANRDDIAVIG